MTLFHQCGAILVFFSRLNRRRRQGVPEEKQIFVYWFNVSLRTVYLFLFLLTRLLFSFCAIHSRHAIPTFV